MNNPPQSIKLIGNKVAVEFLDEKDTTAGGLHLPSERPISVIRNATVRFVGDFLTEDINVKDVVVVSITNSSPKFTVNGKELRVYETKDILAVLK